MFKKAVVFIGGVALGAYAMYNHLFRKAVYKAAEDEANTSENETEDTEKTEE